MLESKKQIGRSWLWRWALPALAIALWLMPHGAQAARIKDLAQLDGVRDNQLLGFGLVGGLAGTGDDPKSAPFTAEAIANMLASFGLRLEPAQIKVKNFAAVMVSADLPAYINNGDRLDVAVSAIGTAKSLEGGVLYETLLKGANGQVYAVAQGSLSLGALVGGAGGGGGRSKRITTVARIPGGALVENTVPSTLLDASGCLRLNLTHPDFTTAQAIAQAINTELGSNAAQAEDAGCVAVRVPAGARGDLVPFIARIEELQAEPGGRARVVINQRTGTIVLGQDVQIMPVAVSHGKMTLTFGRRVKAPAADLPPLATEAATTAADEGGLTPEEQQAGAARAELISIEPGMLLKPTTAEEVAVGLNKLSLTPPDIVAIFEAIDAAGALLGELEII